MTALLESREKASGAWVIFALGAPLLLANALAVPLDQDEEAYIAVAALARDHALYSGILVNQPPIQSWLMSLLFQPLETGYFLTARLLGAVIALAAALLFHGTARLLGAGRGQALFLTFLFITLPVAGALLVSARNDGLALVLCLLALFCFLKADKAGAGISWLVLAGAAGSLAVGVKLTAAFVPFCLFLFLLLERRRPVEVVALALGGLLGALPSLAALGSAPGPFIFGVFRLHPETAGSFYFPEGPESLLAQRLASADDIGLYLLRNPTLLLALVMLPVLALFSRRAGGAGPPASGTQKRRLGLLVAFGFLCVFIPAPVFYPHILPVTPYLLLLSWLLIGEIRQRVSATGWRGVIIGCFALLTLQTLQMATTLSRLVDPELRPVASVTSVAERIEDAMSASGLKGPIASVHSLLVLEAGSPIFAAFSLGPYFYRSGDIYPPEEVLQRGGITPQSLDLVFTAQGAPDAVLVGAPSDEALENWALRNCYRLSSGSFEAWTSGPYNSEQWTPRLYLRARNGHCAEPKKD